MNQIQVDRVLLAVACGESLCLLVDKNLTLLKHVMIQFLSSRLKVKFSVWLTKKKPENVSARTNSFIVMQHCKYYGDEVDNNIFLLHIQTSVLGHGRLMDPPSRGAMWRFGFETEVNYNDNENFCGGVVGKDFYDE